MEIVLWLVITVAIIAGYWKTFEKAGQPGWAAVIPIYNLIVMLRIVHRPLWWILLLFVPLLNIVIFIVIGIDLAKRFGKSALYGVGIALLGFIFVPMLGFGNARYLG
ncbi:DUF5684 domain-containing protein [Paucidesulfovibrio longus]|uniref:DUF5684 domain-containing protein n=1 Tax=Paucidesulfovibrio longus TaxID=889 RepID=UPI0004012891|nr:DUF5684 domain-containing protein [Paucidesulfovibrio longus]